jgi:hypothetical protein
LKVPIISLLDELAWDMAKFYAYRIAMTAEMNHHQLKRAALKLKSCKFNSEVKSFLFEKLVYVTPRPDYVRVVMDFSENKENLHGSKLRFRVNDTHHSGTSV